MSYSAYYRGWNLYAGDSAKGMYYVNHVGGEVEKKWKDLLDTFRRHLKSGSAGGSAAERASQWRFYQRMSFIKPYIGHKE